MLLMLRVIMYCLTVEYLKCKGSRFDFEYYENSHIPLVKNTYSPLGLREIIIRKEVGSSPGENDKLFVSVSLIFDSLHSMKCALASSGDAVSNDVVNYTSATVVYCFSEFIVLGDLS